MTFECARCGFSSNKKDTFRTHVYRKNVCEPKLDASISKEQLIQQFENATRKSFTCECGKSYGSEKGFMLHQSACETFLNKDVVVPRSRLQELESKVHTLEKALQKNGSNTINQHFHVHLTDFGKEDFNDLPTEFFRECLTNGALGVLQMIEKIWFNEEKPENFNVRFTSVKNMLVELYKNPSWVSCGFQSVVDRMITTSQTKIIMGSKLNEMAVNELILKSVDSIQNLKPEIKRKIKDVCKGNLVERRKMFATPKP
jgi:BMFP domain-containing protein YqiC